MKLFNSSAKKNGRALIIDPKFIIKGGSFQEHDREKTRAYFNPQTRIEVTDAYGKVLVRMYPDLIMQLDETNTPIEKVTKKVSKKVAAKKVVIKKKAKAKR